VKNCEGAKKRLREVTRMRNYAAATALVIALNITMLAPAVSRVIPLLHEEECDGWAHGLRAYAIACHCSFECHRQYRYTVRSPCSPGMPGYVSGMKGLCDRLVVPVETALACVKTCLKAKDPSKLPRL
jgi:hypothetical protein